MKINWIVLDMDGTLLNSLKELPIRFFEVKKELEALGIQFILASGRQYERMRTVVSPHHDDFMYLSDNGTKVYQHNQLISSVTIDNDVSHKIIETAQKKMDVQYVVNALQGAYFLKQTDQETQRVFDEFYENQILVDNFDEITDFIKISFYNASDDFSGQEALDSFKSDVNITHSGPTWLDVVHKDISKGVALKMMAQNHDIDLAGVMVFGDAMNDADMLAVAGFPIIMENGDERLKNLGYYQTKSNDEDGVMLILDQLLAHQGDASWLKN